MQLANFTPRSRLDQAALGLRPHTHCVASLGKNSAGGLSPQQARQTRSCRCPADVVPALSVVGSSICNGKARLVQRLPESRLFAPFGRRDNRPRRTLAGQMERLRLAHIHQAHPTALPASLGQPTSISYARAISHMALLDQQAVAHPAATISLPDSSLTLGRSTSQRRRDGSRPVPATSDRAFL